MQPEQKFLAVDSEVLLALTAGVPNANKAVKFFRSRDFLPRVTPTVHAILKDWERHAPETQDRMLAQRVIQDIYDSGCVITPIDDAYRQVIDIHTDNIIQKGILPACKKADILILLEASYVDAHALLTTSKPLLATAHDSLKLALLDAGLHPIFVISPREVADYVGKFETAMEQFEGRETI